MNVLLLQDVKGVGRRYEVKSVSDGYARNFLFPRKLAVLADKNALSLKQRIEQKEKSDRENLERKHEELKSEQLEFTLKTGGHGETFGSVSAAEIEKALEERGFGGATLEDRHSIKTAGEHLLRVNFGKGVRGEIKVVVRTESLGAQP